MISLLWDGTGLYQKDNKLITAPGECCCCDQTCTIPSDLDIINSGCVEIIWAQCSGTGCFDIDFSDCLTNIPSGLTEQGYHILSSGDFCCNCSGFALQDVYACCSGYVDTLNIDDLLLPANVSGDCALCYGVSGIFLENIDDEYFWRIPKCVLASSSSSSSSSEAEPEFYCILE